MRRNHEGAPVHGNDKYTGAGMSMILDISLLALGLAPVLVWWIVAP